MKFMNGDAQHHIADHCNNFSVIGLLPLVEYFERVYIHGKLVVQPAAGINLIINVRREFINLKKEIILVDILCSHFRHSPIFW